MIGAWPLRCHTRIYMETSVKLLDRNVPTCTDRDMVHGVVCGQMRDLDNSLKWGIFGEATPPPLHFEVIRVQYSTSTSM
jgi:hypothetical protein